MKRKSLTKNDELSKQRPHSKGIFNIVVFRGGNAKINVINNHAAQKIQCAVRKYQAKQRVQQLIRRRFVKLYDEVNKEYVYKDKFTQEIAVQKPRLLGNSDLQTPRSFEAPDDYDPGIDTVEHDGHAIVITISSFSQGDKLPELPLVVNDEHKKLADVLAHDFVCKFPAENVISLTNPNRTEFLKAFHMLRQVCRANGFLLVYICTHVVTAVHGDGKNSKETGYFAMHDTDWTNPKSIASTSVSISHLIELLNDILTREKTVILNYAHQKKPPKKLFKAVKLLYPPPDCLTRIADGAVCTVIGSCAIESFITDIVTHTPLPKKDAKKLAESKFAGNNGNSPFMPASHSNGDSAALVRKKQKKFPALFGCFRFSKSSSRNKQKKQPVLEFQRKQRHVSGLIYTDASLQQPGVGAGVGAGAGGAGAIAGARAGARSSATNMGGGGGAVHRVAGAAVLSEDALTEAELDEFEEEWTPMIEEEIKARYFDDWQVKQEKPLVASAYPEAPLPTVIIDPETKELSLSLPIQEELSRHRRSVLFWRLRRTFGPPANVLRSLYRARKRRLQTAPAQIGLATEDHTLFGKALYEAFKGGAAVPTSGVVTAEALFKQVFDRVKAEAATIPMAVEEPAKKRKLFTNRRGKQKNDKKKKKKKKKRRKARRGSGDAVGDDEADDVSDSENENKNNEKEITEQGDDTKKTGKNKAKGKSKGDKSDGNKVENEGGGDTGNLKIESGDVKAKKTVSTGRKNKGGSNEEVGDAEGVAAGDATAVKKVVYANQSPVMVVPHDRGTTLSRLVLNSVSLRCSPPPAPEKPYIKRTGRTDATLIWYNPPFDGVPAANYKLYMRNVSRNFNNWSEIDIPHPGTIAKNEFLVRNLPPGIQCQFKVSASNNGGWGQLSEPSAMITPGSEQTPISTAKRKTRLILGGPLAILDRLQLYPKHREEHVWGLSRLVTCGILNNGFKKSQLQKRLAHCALQDLEMYPDDLEIAVPAFALLGWALRGPASLEVAKLCTDGDIVELCKHGMKNFRSDSRLINSIAWLRGSLPKDIVIPLPQKIIPMVPVFANFQKKKNKGQDDSDDDDDFADLLLEGSVAETHNEETKAPSK